MTLKKYKVGSKLEAYDIQMRMDEISSFDEDVANWSDSTSNKINVQYRKALKDVGLFNGIRLIKEANAKSSFWNYFEEHNENWFLTACFRN